MSILPPFRLEAWFSRWEFRAEFNLAASDAESWSLEELLALASPVELQRWADLRLGYTETFGAPALRHAIARTYTRIDAPDVISFAGGEEALFCAFHAILETGDHAVVVAPNYQSAETIPLSICAVDGVSLRAENGWRLDVDELRKAVTPRTRLIALNFPNNPTGALISSDDLNEVVRIAAERDIYLLSDEAYRGLERDASNRLPQAADLYERGLSLGVLSKAYGLPGLRVGWIACRNGDLVKRLERMKHYLSICSAAPSEVLGTIAIEARDMIWERNNGIVQGNLGLVRAFLARWSHLFEGYDPAGGCTAFPRYLGDDGVERFCESVVKEAGVLLLPASVFQSRLCAVPTDRFRIGFGRRNLAQALERLDGYLEGRTR